MQAMLDDQSPLLIKATLLSICAMGTWAFYVLLDTFESVLKPFAFSLMAYAIIQYVSEKTYVFFYEAWSANDGWLHDRIKTSPKLSESEEGSEQCPRREFSFSGLGRKLLTPSLLIQQTQNGELQTVLLPYDKQTQEQRLAGRRRRLAKIGRGFCKCMTAIVLLASCVLMFYLVDHFIVQQLLQMDWTPYKNGFLEVWKGLKRLGNGFVPLSEETNTQLETSLENAVEKYAAALSSAAFGVVGVLSNAVQGLIFFLLYLILWFSAPCEALRPFVTIAGTYMTLKTFCNGVYAAVVLVVLLLPVPGCRFSFDLASAIALCCFFLAYIPEVGALVATGMPLIFAGLDARVPPPDRVVNGVVVLCIMLVIKFAIGSFLEATLMAAHPTLSGQVPRSGRQQHAAEVTAHAPQETHPALVLVLVMLAASVWNVSGMIVCVPLIGLVRHFLAVEYEKARASALGSNSSISEDAASS